MATSQRPDSTKPASVRIYPSQGELDQLRADSLDAAVGSDSTKPAIIIEQLAVYPSQRQLDELRITAGLHDAARAN